MKRKAKGAKEYKVRVGHSDSLAGRQIAIMYNGEVVAVIRLSAALGISMRVETFRPMFSVEVVQMPDYLRPLTRREKEGKR